MDFILNRKCHAKNYVSSDASALINYMQVSFINAQLLRTQALTTVL